MKTWTIIVVLFWLAISFSEALPNHEVTEEFSTFAMGGGTIELNTSASAMLASTRYFAVQTEQKLAPSAKVNDDFYVMMLEGDAGEVWDVVDGSPIITIWPAANNKSVDFVFLKSIDAYLWLVIKLSFAVLIIWSAGSLIITAIKRA